jgi:DNA repair protein RadB
VTNTVLDKLLNGGIEKGAITNFYGEAGSGKTNIMLIITKTVIDNNQKVIFIDTESNFSIERFNQITENKSSEYLDKIYFFEPKTWNEQCEQIKGIEDLVKKENIGLIVVDSMVSLYRLELTDENFVTINKELSKQYAILSNIAREKNIPVVVTNQIYSISGKIELTSRLIAKYWAKTLVKLEKLDRPNHRLATIIKHRAIPEGKNIEFEITQTGIKEVGKFSIF